MYIIPSAVILRTMVCLVCIMTNEEEQNVYKKRIKNVIMFGIFTELIFVFKDIIYLYYG